MLLIIILLLWGYSELGKLKIDAKYMQIYVRMCVVDCVAYNVDADTGCLVSHYISVL